MVSNIVVRNKRTEYVTFVAKARVDGDSRTVEYICGLGTMTHEEFKAFQKWAHSMKDQEMRRARVLACPFVVEEKVKVEGKVAASIQKKTTVKRAPKKTVVKDKYTPEEREAERTRFRKEYEAKKQIKVKKVKKVVTVNGILFTGRKSIGDRRQIIDKRIEQLKLHVSNAKTEIRTGGAGKGGTWKIVDAKEKIVQYEGAIRTLKSQRAGLRR